MTNELRPNPPAAHDNGDPWTLTRGRDSALQTHETQRPVLRIETIEGVRPLDAQIGIFSKKTVPDILYDVIFGQSAPTEAEIEGRNGDTEITPPLQTYAILDAAKIANLPQLLENSGLEYRCLFKGDAYDELKDVAPWIVRLEEGNSFIRNLFTKSDLPWHLWDTSSGLYLRSRGTLEQLWKHFRKFTRVRDEAGKWFYFRFWEAGCLIDYLRFAERRGASYLQPLFGRNPNSPSLSMVHTYVSLGPTSAQWCSMPRTSGHNSDAHKTIDISASRFLSVRAHARGFTDSYFEGNGPPISAHRLQKAKDMATHLAQKYHGLGFKSRYHLGSFTYWALALNADFESTTQLIQDQIRQTDNDPNERFAIIAREMKALYGPKIRNYRGYGS